MRSLPHRQLRKLTGVSRTIAPGSLPHRQLRKHAARVAAANSCSLPHRQLRKATTDTKAQYITFTAA